MILFTIHTRLDGEHRVIEYDSVQECLDDVGLEILCDQGAKCSLWQGTLKLTPELSTWERVRRAVVDNATVLLRGQKG